MQTYGGAVAAMDSVKARIDELEYPGLVRGRHGQ
jgi:hypothetical protein